MYGLYVILRIPIEVRISVGMVMGRWGDEQMVREMHKQLSRLRKLYRYWFLAKAEQYNWLLVKE